MTTDDEFFMHALASQSAKLRGKKPPAPPSQDRSLRWVATGAAISAPHLFIVTLERSGETIQLVAQKSGGFELEGRDTHAVKALWRDVEDFTSAAGIGEIALRVAQDRGNMPAKPWAYKIEAILQLLSTVDVTLVATQSVRNWVNREDPELPGPWIEPTTQFLRGQQMRALETAAFALLGGLDSHD
jgi:hypothetical protein